MIGPALMAKAPKKEKQTQTAKIPNMPFDDALRVLLKAPPKHKKAKKKSE
jgi:hypothetical protein